MSPSDKVLTAPSSVRTAALTPSSASSSGVQAHRVIFIDLGRALAVTFMVYGHTASALLAPEYQVGRWFEVWQFQRGLTSSLFLLLGGFAFSVATSRHWSSHAAWSPAILRRLRRFALFVLLGYALHLPVREMGDLLTVDEARWQSFVAVDVLQLIGASLIGLQLLVLAARTRRAFTVSTFALAGAVIAATPSMWRADWSGLPVAAAAYLSPAAGSLFPLFPWMGFVLLGAGFGQVYGRWGASHLRGYAQALLLPGVALLAVAAALRLGQPELFGAAPGSEIPAVATMRIGACLVILAAIAHLSRRLTRLPHLFGAVAQESLLIYFVHLCLVYGSVWNRGLVSVYGGSLTPAHTLFWIATVIASMLALAWYWNGWKHTRPRAARVVSLVVGAVLVGLLL